MNVIVLHTKCTKKDADKKRYVMIQIAFICIYIYLMCYTYYIYIIHMSRDGSRPDHIAG